MSFVSHVSQNFESDNFSNKIQEIIQKMETENTAAKGPRNEKINYWKTHNLVDSLYNDNGTGEKIPQASDIDQGSYHNLDYLIKYTLSNCYLLANLMGLAIQKPEFITTKLITKENDNTVKVNFYKVNIANCFSNDKFCGTKIDKSTVSYLVTKDEALEWKTSHKALWPVVIEIAYTKYLKDIITEKNPSICNYPNFNIRRLAMIGGKPSKTLTDLTGEIKSNPDTPYHHDNPNNIFFKDRSEFKAFKTKDYSSEVLNIYNKIKNKLESNQIITASFEGTNPLLSDLLNALSAPIKIDDALLALNVITLPNQLQKYGEKFINELIRKKIISETDYKNWLDTNKLTLEDLIKPENDNLQKQFILNLLKKNKISKTKLGIFPGHAYIIVKAFEYEGYKYIVLKNPHDMETKIKYNMSKKLPETVKLPDQPKEKNECIMELNHFCKKLDSIDL